jgi:tRNA (cmo5U34)-methyltransferase
MKILKQESIKKISEEIELFKKVCPHFDKLQDTVGKEIEDHFRNSKKEIINVIEVGCGTGNTTRIILNCDKRTYIVAIDIDKEALNYSESIMTNFIKERRVKFIREDALKFLRSCENSSFDVFASAFTLHNFTEEYRKEILKQIHRVLRNGGLFVNADKYALDKEKEHSETFYWQIMKFSKEYSKLNRLDLAKHWKNHYFEDNKPDKMMKEKESIRQMKRIGFEDKGMVFRRKMEAVLVAQKSK